MLSHDCTRSRCQIEAVDSRQRPDCRTHLSIITTASRPPITQRGHRRLGVLPSGLPRRKETTGSYPKQRLSKASRWACPSELVPVDLSRWTCPVAIVPVDTMSRTAHPAETPACRLGQASACVRAVSNLEPPAAGLSSQKTAMANSCDHLTKPQLVRLRTARFAV